MCEQPRKDGTTCPNPARYWVQSNKYQANSLVCGVHLPQTVRELSEFSNKLYKMVPPAFRGSGVRVTLHTPRNQRP